MASHQVCSRSVVHAVGTVSSPPPSARRCVTGHGHGPDPLGEPLLGEGLLAVDGEVADFEDLVLVAGATEHQAR